MIALLEAVLVVPFWAVIAVFVVVLMIGLGLGVVLAIVLEDERRRRRHWRTWQEDNPPRRW